MIFLEEPNSQFQFSCQATFISLSLICPSTCLMLLKSLRFKFLLDLLKNGVSIFPNFLPRLQPQLHTVFAEPFSLLGRLSQLSVQGFFGDFLSRGMHDVLISISLFSFDWEMKMVATTDSPSTFTLVACMLARLSTDSGRCFQRLTPEDPDMVETLLAAVCLLLLDAPGYGTSGSSAAEMMVASSRHWKLSGRLICVCSS